MIILILLFVCKQKIFINLSTHPVCLRQTLLYERGITPCQWSVVSGR